MAAPFAQSVMFKKKNMAKTVEIIPFLKLFKIFTDKKWTDADGYRESLERFGELMNHLKEEELNLILELVGRYRYYSFNDYHNQLRRSLIELHAKYLNGIEKVYLFPIIKPTDQDKTKSGHAVMYFIDSIKPSIGQYNNINFSQLNKYEDITEGNLSLTEKELILFVDDYVGTGNTLNKTLKEIKTNKSIGNKYAIVTVMIQEVTKDFLNKENVKLIYGESTNKGISSHYNGQDLRKKRKIMKDIERLIPNLSNYSFGYEASEALVTMIKTPNNTFPIFWKDFLIKGKKYKAPFPRH